MPSKTHEIVINNIVRLNITFLNFKNDANNDILVELGPRSDTLFYFWHHDISFSSIIKYIMKTYNAKIMLQALFS